MSENTSMASAWTEVVVPYELQENILEEHAQGLNLVLTGKLRKQLWRCP